ncbi:MAG: gluconate 2-dehydrogenase subunit 3 family protein [Thermomicrobiales bacterium]
MSAAGLLFFFFDEFNALDAMVARIVPGDEGDPGAREAGVTAYIDRALAGPYKDWGLQYHEGLRLVNAYALEAYGKKLHALAEDEQDAVVGALEAGKVPGFEDGGTAFFAMVWAHTIEGLLCDPAYGGNRDAVGWKLIGFPGAQYGYTAEQMQYGADLTKLPIMTLADIQKLTVERPDLFYTRSGSFLAPTREEVPAMPSEENTLDTAKNQGG